MFNIKKREQHLKIKFKILLQEIILISNKNKLSVEKAIFKKKSNYFLFVIWNVIINDIKKKLQIIIMNFNYF